MSESKTKLTSLKKTTSDKKEIRVSVEEIENGFLIIRNKEWQDPKKGWQYETKRWYSAENPLEINTENKSLADLFDS